MDDELQLVLLVEQGPIRLRFLQVQTQWRVIAVLVPEMATCPDLKIEFDRSAVGLRVLEHAGQIIVFRTFADKRCKWSSNRYVKCFVVLKQRVRQLIHVRQRRGSQKSGYDYDNCAVQEAYFFLLVIHCRKIPRWHRVLV